MKFIELPISAQTAIRNDGQAWDHKADVPIAQWIKAMKIFNLITPEIETDLFPYLFAE